ncbi:hypothetical protein NC651_039895 [Populus alba x Populus x berolinensis]|nr:hypothetical protein NC651_039895 [Populus alba x Populus x berolinensis]
MSTPSSSEREKSKCSSSKRAATKGSSSGQSSTVTTSNGLGMASRWHEAFSKIGVVAARPSSQTKDGATGERTGEEALFRRIGSGA